MNGFKCGNNCVISSKANIGNDVIFGNNCIVEDGVSISDNCYIDSNTIIRSGSVIEKNSTISSNCIIGEYQKDFYYCHKNSNNRLLIGQNAIIRSGTIIYNGSVIGDCFQSGHNVTIREGTKIGNHVSVGTLSDIQGNCEIGDYVRLHSNVHVGMASRIDGYNWIYPFVCLTNDPTPPSEVEMGVHIYQFAIVATGSIILPGIQIKSDSLVGAGAIVTKDVEEFSVVVGNPAKVISDVRKIKNRETGKPNYPWRYRFKRNMPWEHCGYDEWVASLSDDDRKKFGLY